MIVSTISIMDTMDNVGSVLGGAERRGEDGRRRRTYTIERKRELVEATMQPGASVSVVAQHHGVNANLLFTWRRQMREARPEATGTAAIQPMQFLPVGIVSRDPNDSAAADVASRATEPAGLGSAARSERIKQRRGSCRIEIDLPNGVRLRVEDAIEAAALRQMIAVLKEAW